MSDISGSIDDVDARIAILRENLRQLVEQAAAQSGAADDELMAQRIAEQEAQLDILNKRRAELSQAPSDKPG